MKSVAIVAPDTDAGKTVITAALLTLVKKIIGKSTVMKPVQTGAELVDGRRLSPDITTIEELTGHTIPRDLYHHVVPYNYMVPCSPHLAAKKEIGQISFGNIKKNLTELHMRFRMTLVESAGGLMSPLTETETNLDLIKYLKIPVIVVSQNRLGAISATLSTHELLKQAGVEVLGTVMVDPEKIDGDLDEEILADNVKTIESLSGVSPIVRVPRVENLKEDFEVITIVLEEFAQKVFGK